MPEANLGNNLGQACTQTWIGHVSETNPQAQIALASQRLTGTGVLFVQQGNNPARYEFGIICLRGCLVVAPQDAVRVVETVERYMRVPVPWTVPAGSGQAQGVRFSWCGPSFSCPGQERNGSKDQTGYYPNTYTTKSLCLPMYDTTQRKPDGRVDSYAAGASDFAWKTFWLEVGDAIRRFNAGEPAVR